MRKFGIVVDSLVNLNFKGHLFSDATQVSLSFMMNDSIFNENNIKEDQIKKLDKKIELKTIPPKTETFIKAFAEQKELGYEKIIYLASSKYFTNAYDQAMLSKTILNDPNIYVIDTKTFGPGIEYLLEILDINQNMKFQDLINLLLTSIDKIDLLMVKDKYIKIGKIKIPLPMYEIVLFKDEFIHYKNIYKRKALQYLNKYMSKNMLIGEKTYVKVFSSKSSADAKLLAHEIHTINKEVKISIYGVIPFTVSHQLKEDSLGILCGNYGG